MGRTMTPERSKLANDAVLLRYEGLSEYQIANRLGVPRITIHVWLVNHGVPRPVKNYRPLPLNTVHLGAAEYNLRRLPPDYLDLVFADPPYNIGVDYGNGTFQDKLEIYYEKCREWFLCVAHVLKQGGAFYFMHYPEQCADLKPSLEGVGLFLQRWITWYYPTNIGQSSNNWTRAQRTILFCTKGPEPAYFNGLADPQPYRNPTDKRIIENLKTRPGVTPYDVWEYNLVKNVSQDKTSWPNQLPVAMLERIVKTSCPENGIVCDPFMGSGTTAVAAVRNGRQWIGFDMQRASKQETERRIGELQIALA